MKLAHEVMLTRPANSQGTASPRPRSSAQNHICNSDLIFKLRVWQLTGVSCFVLRDLPPNKVPEQPSQRQHNSTCMRIFNLNLDDRVIHKISTSYLNNAIARKSRMHCHVFSALLYRLYTFIRSHVELDSAQAVFFGCDTRKHP